MKKNRLSKKGFPSSHSIYCILSSSSYCPLICLYVWQIDGSCYISNQELCYESLACTGGGFAGITYWDQDYQSVKLFRWTGVTVFRYRSRWWVLFFCLTFCFLYLLYYFLNIFLYPTHQGIVFPSEVFVFQWTLTRFVLIYVSTYVFIPNVVCPP